MGGNVLPLPALDTRTDAVVVSLDGRSAYDSISRAAFLAKLREVAPFVRLFYGQPSQYCWWDSEGQKTTPRACSATCRKVKDASRGIRWLQRFSRWGSRIPWPEQQRR